ncbi:MAG: ATP-binding protein [candidate division WOR-3 bacterium]
MGRRDINSQYLEAVNRYCYLLLNSSLKFRRKKFDYPVPMEIPDQRFFYRSLSETLPPAIETEMRRVEGKIEEIKERAKEENFIIPLEQIRTQYGLSKEEWLILAFLFFARFNEGHRDKKIEGLTLLRLVFFRENPLNKIEILSPKGKLRGNGLIKLETDRYSWEEKRMLFEESFSLTEEIFYQIAGVENWRELEDLEKERPKESLLIIREPEISFNHLVLPREVKEKIDNALWQYENGEKVYERYGLKEKIPYCQPVVILFYGPSGTGKTATSEAIAKHLNKKIGIANYAQIYDCWVGESEKNILRLFTEAKRKDCLLLFDEADSLFAERFNEGRSVERMHNLMTNLLMQKLEDFSGIIILTTNREVVIDKAFERRILLKLKFDLPPKEMRIKIWQLFLKDCPQLSRDVSFEELSDYPLPGGKIKNAVIKSAMRCAQENREIKMADLIQAAAEELKSDFRKGERIGF